jgi:hypothetical protein
VPVPTTEAEQEEVAPVFTLFGEQLAETEVMVTGVLIAMVAKADLVGFWVEVAVIVAVPETGAVAGAVYTPAEEIVPALADQVTAEL